MVCGGAEHPDCVLNEDSRTATRYYGGTGGRSPPVPPEENMRRGSQFRSMQVGYSAPHKGTAVKKNLPLF